VEAQVRGHDIARPRALLACEPQLEQTHRLEELVAVRLIEQ
jgi:hypothetical protein